MIEPSNTERAEWPDTTRDYVEGLEAKLEATERKIEQFRERTNRCQTCAKTDEECERRTTGLEPLVFVSTCAMWQAKALTQEDKGEGK